VYLKSEYPLSTKAAAGDVRILDVRRELLRSAKCWLGLGPSCRVQSLGSARRGRGGGARHEPYNVRYDPPRSESAQSRNVSRRHEFD
jgi:hypothetical protein